MTTDRQMDRLFELLDRAERLARPPYRRHSAERLAKVHAVHSEIGQLMMRAAQKELRTQELYKTGGGQ
jgi:nitrogen-specific signal transduction histidine kinase